MLDDAVDVAIHDQEEAGIEVVSDGEMRRAGFFTAEFYRHLVGRPDAAAGAPDRGRRARPAASPGGHLADRGARRARGRRRVPLRRRPGEAAVEGDAAGAVHPVRSTRGRAGRGLSGPDLGRGRRSSRCSRPSCARLVDAGATIIQVDEPSPAIHPERRGRLRGTRQRGDRAGGRSGPARCPSLLRELPRSAARQADVPADPRRDAPLPGRRARPRVRQPGAGRARAGGRGRSGGSRRGGRGHRRQELLRRDGGRRRRADRSGARDRAAARSPDGRARLWLQPDRAIPDGGQAPGAGGRARPRLGRAAGP